MLNVIMLSVVMLSVVAPTLISILTLNPLNKFDRFCITLQTLTSFYIHLTFSGQSLPECKTFRVPRSKGESLPYPQTLDYAGKAC
jgi:hypothetical protein